MWLKITCIHIKSSPKRRLFLFRNTILHILYFVCRYLQCKLKKSNDMEIANLWSTYIHKCKLQPYQQLHTLAQGIIKVMWCEMLSMWLHFSICATIAFSALLLTQREASTQEGLSYKEKVALLLRGWWKVAHSTFSSLNTVHRFLVPDYTQKILTEIWHQFWQKNDGENICHWNYFQIPRALSELCTS